MARFEFRLPDIGEGVHEGEIVTWHVAQGGVVHEDEPMVEVMTDKATVNIMVPKAGIVERLCARVGETMRVGDVLIVIETDRTSIRPTDDARPSSEPPIATPTETKASAVGDIRDSLPGTAWFRGQPAELDETSDAYFEARPRATPATRALASELGVDLHRVRPSGDDDRITDDDVRAFHMHSLHRVPRPSGHPRDKRVPFVGLRRAIAKRMQHAVTTAAHFTFVEECDFGRLLALRDTLRPLAKDKGVELTLLPFIVKASALALARHPIMNSMLDDQAAELVYRGEYHVGVATATPAGLMVPVVRDADTRSLLSLAREIERLARKAREGTLSHAELSGSTFTVTSLGKRGGLLATPVLNLPEVGILGVHQVKRKPVVRGDRIEIGEIALLSLTCDHRIVDGDVCAGFAYTMIELLERPELLFPELVAD
jgi:pyruvate dehydrogenase E2 component (dihydrolipoamide acetyltransferase)